MLMGGLSPVTQTLAPSASFPSHIFNQLMFSKFFMLHNLILERCKLCGDSTNINLLLFTQTQYPLFIVQLLKIQGNVLGGAELSYIGMVKMDDGSLLLGRVD